ncbi:hypothetical protein Leryth_015511 [Lithospermum erythrorhizon]|nr:hypothetical protein Leryth_015511 [Lithospermum erythrorhizon]
MEYMESIKKLEEKWSLNQLKQVSNGLLREAHLDSGNGEVSELKRLLQIETNLRKTAVEELIDLKDQLAMCTSSELSGKNGEIINLRRRLEDESRHKRKLEEELIVLRTQLSQMTIGSGHPRSSHPSLDFSSLRQLQHNDVNNGERASFANLHEQVGLHKILSLLESEDTSVRIHAVKVVANLAAEEANQEKIVEAGGLTSLLMLLRTYEDETIRRIAAGAIANLAMNEANQELIMSQGGICLLALTAADADDPQTLRMVAGAIANLCGNEKLQSRLRSEGGIKALIGMEKCRHLDVLSQVARGIANFAKCESRASTQDRASGRSLLIEDGALPWIVQNANNDASVIRRHVELALCHLAQHEINTKNLISGGALWELVRIARECTREDVKTLAHRTLTTSSTLRNELRRLRIEL